MDGSGVRVDAGMRGPVPIPVSRTNRCRVNSMASQKKRREAGCYNARAPSIDP